MDVPPDLAEKVLKAEVRNIVKNVGDGGTLTAAQREMMQAFAMSPDSARQARAFALIQKYCTGSDLTPGQWAEIREIYPDFASDPAPAPTPSAAPESPPPAAPAIHSGDTEVTRQQLDRWSALYGVEHRQLRRWIARGREKGDPCPLDDPISMPAWIEKHLEKIRSAMRDRVSAAAEAARSQAPPSPVAAAAPSTAPVPPVSAPPPAGPTVAPLDLASVGGIEGETVTFFRRIFAGVKQQLEDAYLAGAEERIRTLHSRLEKVGESLRKHEIAAEVRARRNGDLLEKATVLNDVAQLLRTMKLMHEQTAKRVLAELPEIEPATLERIRQVILREREREVGVLRKLSALRGADDVLFALAA